MWILIYYETWLWLKWKLYKLKLCFLIYEYDFQNNCFDLGMNPKSVGVLKTDEPVKPQDVVVDKMIKENEDSSLDNVDEKKSEIEEDGMLEQDFLLDPSMTVGQVATDYGIDVLDFVRYECGET